MSQHSSEPATESQILIRRVGIVAFLFGLLGTLAFFAFFPGLPHVIDTGAILVSVVVAVALRWACQSWLKRGER